MTLSKRNRWLECEYSSLAIYWTWKQLQVGSSGGGLDVPSFLLEIGKQLKEFRTLLALDGEGVGQADQLLVGVISVVGSEPLRQVGLRLVEGTDKRVQTFCLRD